MRRRRISNRVWIALITVYVVWGSTYLGIRVAVETIPPFLMAGVRFLISGAVLFAVSVRRGDAVADPIGARQWRAATLVGGLLLLCGNGGIAWAEQQVPISVTALIVAGVPLWMALFSAAIGEERLRSATMAGIAVGFAGTAVLVVTTGSHHGPVRPVGLAVVVVASLCWATGSVMSRRVGLPRRPILATGMQMLCGGGLLMIVAAVTGELAHFHLSQVSAPSAMGLLYLTLIGSFLGFTAYVWLLKNASTSLVSTYAYVNPIIAVLLGVVVLGERLTGVTVLAAALIVGAVALIVLGQRRTQEELTEVVEAA